jgi:hypothetical protein
MAHRGGTFCKIWLQPARDSFADAVTAGVPYRYGTLHAGCKCLTFTSHDYAPCSAVGPGESSSDSDSDLYPCPCPGCDCDCGSGSHSHFHPLCGSGCARGSGSGSGSGSGFRFRFCYGDGLGFDCGSYCWTTSSVGAWISTCCAHAYMDGLSEL